MKRTLTAILILLSVNSFAASYYVSSEGNDANSGTSPAEPWKSLEKVNSFRFLPGDQVLFKKDDVWRGTLKVSDSGENGKLITYGAYGEGANPVIFGSEVITGWTLHEGSIYKAAVSSETDQVFVNGVRLRLARYPDEGYLTINAVAGTTVFTSNELDPGLNYANATWYGRTRYWFGVIRNVVSSSSKTITLNSAPNGDLAVNQGFVLMNKLEFLNQPGEWYFDKDSNQLYLWTPEGDSPENYVITGSMHTNGIDITRQNYIQFTGIDIREHSKNGIYIFGGNSIVIENNNILQSGQYGISAEGAGSLTIRNNEINRAIGGGMWLWSKDSHITDNKIYNTGIFGEIGLLGTGQPNGGSGAEISGENNIIEYNIIENTNYNGLFYRGAGSVIQYNLINNTCLTKDDGGAIYTNTSGSGATIRYNIILNSIGNPDGYISTRSMAEGIYIDEIAQNVKVEHNTVKNTGDAAIKLHNVGNIEVNNNRIMTARYGIFCNKFVGTPSSVTNNTIYMTSKSDDYEPRPLFVRVATYNTVFNNNRYINPYVTTGVFRESSYLSFSQWKSVTKQDEHSVFNGTALAAGESAELIYNASKTSKTYNLNGATVRDTDGNSIISSFTLEPYTSIIISGQNIDNISEVITGVEEIKSNSYLRCYPNPFQNNITIETGRHTHDNFNLEIYDVSGKLIKKFINKQGQFNYYWDGRNMNGDDMLPGLYVVQLVSGGKIETAKIVKTR